MTAEILGTVVDVYRRCRHCGEWKPLEHYLKRTNRSQVLLGSWKWCAACRARTPQQEWERASRGPRATKKGYCQHCGRSFFKNASAKYCSDRCRGAHNHGLRTYGAAYVATLPDAVDLPGEDGVDMTDDGRDESRLEWDGVSQLHHTPQRKDYFLTCMACARHVSLKLTDSDTRLIPQQRCQHCGGRMLLEPDAGKAKIGAGMTSDVRAPMAVLPDSRI